MDGNAIKVKIKEIQQDKNLTNEEKNRQIQSLYSKNTTPVSVEKCTHYNKQCNNFYFKCCNIIDECHRCHRELQNCNITPPQIETIQCKLCNTSQSPSESCIECKIKFSNFYCNICKIWTEFEIDHCDKCGFCRLGKVGSLFHCDDCELCYSSPAHQCTKKSLRKENCPVCFESVHTSQKSSVATSRVIIIYLLKIIFQLIYIQLFRVWSFLSP